MALGTNSSLNHSPSSTPSSSVVLKNSKKETSSSTSSIGLLPFCLPSAADSCLGFFSEGFLPLFHEMEELVTVGSSLPPTYLTSFQSCLFWKNGFLSKVYKGQKPQHAHH